MLGLAVVVPAAATTGQGAEMLIIGRQVRSAFFSEPTRRSDRMAAPIAGSTKHGGEGNAIRFNARHARQERKQGLRGDD